MASAIVAARAGGSASGGDHVGQRLPVHQLHRDGVEHRDRLMLEDLGHHALVRAAELLLQHRAVTLGRDLLFAVGALERNQFQRRLPARRLVLRPIDDAELAAVDGSQNRIVAKLPSELAGHRPRPSGHASLA